MIDKKEETDGQPLLFSFFILKYSDLYELILP